MMRDSLTLYQTGKTYNIEWVSVFRNAIKGQLYDYSNSYYKMNHSQWGFQITSVIIIGSTSHFLYKRSFLPLFPNPFPSEGTLSGSNVVKSGIENRTMVTLQQRSFLRLSVPFLWLLILMKSVRFLPCFSGWKGQEVWKASQNIIWKRDHILSSKRKANEKLTK